MKFLMPALASTKANVAELERLRESQTQLQLRGIIAEASAANFPLLTAKMQPKEVAALKKSFARQGFVEEIDSLEREGKDFAAQLAGKGAAAPSQAWKMLMAAKPEAVLWVAHSSKNAALQAKFKGFYTEWPQAQQKIPYTMMQEMRIVPGIGGLRGAVGEAVLRVDGWEASDAGGDEGVSGALFTASSATTGPSAASARCEEGCQAGEEPKEGCCSGRGKCRLRRSMWQRRSRPFR